MIIGTTEFTEFTAFGSRGHAMMVLRGAEPLWRGSKTLRAIIDELENGHTHPLLKVPMISPEDRLRDYPDIPVFLTTAETHLRERMANRIAEEGGQLVTFNVSDQGLAEVDPAVEYGAGSICAPYTRVGPNVNIGIGTHVLSEMLAHDIHIGDFSTLNVGSNVLGHVEIGRHVTIAPYAIIGNGRPGRPLRIGDGAVIGVGAVVVKDVPPGARMVGNPAMTVEEWKRRGAALGE
jgi:UDP-3-O-[3-hydroxymyristoyl] glucosamine N-acyltransferase